MKEVINEIRNQNVELKRLEDKLDTRFNLVLWVMGIMMALMLALKFFGS